MTDLVTRLLALAVKMKDRSRHITYDDVDEGADALREAAAALSLLLKERDETPAGIYAGQLRVRIDDLEEERDALKAKLAEAQAAVKMLSDTCERWHAAREKAEAKLAEAEKLIHLGAEADAARETTLARMHDRAEKAEAEAAALREAGNALVPFLPDISYGIAAKHSSHQQAVMAFKAALSHPGPGAAYQERHEKLKAWCGYLEKGPMTDEFRERMRKLEAVVTQLATLDCGDNSCYFVERPTGMRTNGGCQCFRDSSPRGPKQAFLAIKALALAALEKNP